MAFEVDDISKFHPPVNCLLIRANREEKYLKLGDDLKIEIDTSYEPEKHSSTHGTVVSLWGGIEDVMVGDEIFFHYLSIMTSVQQKRYIVCEGVPYFILRYESMFCAKREDEVIPLNGHMLVETDIDEKTTGPVNGLLLPESMQNKDSVNEGIVRYVGAPLPEQPNLAKPGDRIYFAKSGYVPLQYELHRTFNRSKSYYRIKHDAVLAILN